MEGGKPENPGKNLRSKEETNHKLKPHVTPGPGIEPGPQGLEVSVPCSLAWTKQGHSHDWLLSSLSFLYALEYLLRGQRLGHQLVKQLHVPSQNDNTAK